MGDRIRVLVNVDSAAAEYLDRWIDAAQDALATAHTEVERLLGGTDVIEVSPEDARVIHDWARLLNGWSDAPAQLKPLLLNRPAVARGSWLRRTVSYRPTGESAAKPATVETVQQPSGPGKVPPAPTATEETELTSYG